MTINAIVSMKTRQSVPGEESYDIEMMCDAEYKYTLGKSIIRYNEPEGSGLGKTTTQIEITDKTVILTRSGDNNSKMCFENEGHYAGVYEMPFGMFSVNINSKKVTISRDDNGAHIVLDYSMELEGVLASVNRLELDVKRKF